MTEEFSHLFPPSRLVAALGAEERIRRIRADRWINYPRAEQALAKLDELLLFPQRARKTVRRPRRNRSVSEVLFRLRAIQTLDDLSRRERSSAPWLLPNDTVRPGVTRHELSVPIVRRCMP
ncbi:TniB family NTP-binding protein [Ensifer canadensis]|uniref:TniB family NTP-binding protein n=1 Tax=Ensifer canadensis TaxID=555315 RepID=UPI001CED0318|nr:TniB family NTP-binding protein [Ensifer canadensis]